MGHPLIALTAPYCGIITEASNLRDPEPFNTLFSKR